MSFYLTDISLTEPSYIGKIIVLCGEKMYVYKIKVNGTIECNKKYEPKLKDSIEHWILNLPCSVHWYKMALLKHEIIRAVNDSKYIHKLVIYRKT
jgi:hypothetical protein